MLFIKCFIKLYTGGDVITAQNETQNLTQKASINDKKEGNIA